MLAVAAILAGGRAQRLGGAKATLRLGGRPLIEYPLAAAQAAGLERFVVAKTRSVLPPLNCEKVAEPDDPTHPLLGLITALECSGGPIVAIACDLPFLAPRLLSALASDPAETVVTTTDRLHPLAARYSPSALPILRQALATKARLDDTVLTLAPKILDRSALSRFGDPDSILFNVNTPSDLAAAESLLDYRGAGTAPSRPNPQPQ